LEPSGGEKVKKVKIEDKSRKTRPKFKKGNYHLGHCRWGQLG